MKTVFNKLQAAELKLQPTKCMFAQEYVKYLGHVVSSEGLQPDPDKISAIKVFPRLESLQDLRCFLGVAGYYPDSSKDFLRLQYHCLQCSRKEWSSSGHQHVSLRLRLSSSN